MTTVKQASQARRSLDKRLTTLGRPDKFAIPRSGWIRALREGLGMSAAVLGRRLGVSGQAVLALEASEMSGRARLDSLRRAAEALECDFVYAFIPRSSLEATVRNQATHLARRQLRATNASMALEDQSTTTDDEVLRENVNRIIASGRQWQDPA